MTTFKEYFTMPFTRAVMDIEYSVLARLWGKKDLEGNTECHFRKSIALGFDGLKTDMELTRDGEIILCHDPGFTLDANGRITEFTENNYIPIRDMDVRQALALEFADPDDAGQYYHPCTLDTMLGLCEEYGRAAYLTLRPEPWREETARRMAELILAHHMQERTIINLYPGCKEAMDYVNGLIPGLVYCNTREPEDALTTELIDQSAAEGYQIICLCRRMIDTVTPEKTAYAASKGIRVWEWEISSIKDAAFDIARGISGFQMFSRDVTPSVVTGILAGLDAAAQAS